MKQMNIIEGVMGIVQKLSSITAELVDKVKRIGHLHIGMDKEKELEKVVGDVRKELVELEKGIEGLNEVREEEDTGKEEVKMEADQDTQNRSVHRRMIDNVIYFERIPSVVKIEPREKDKLLQEKVVDFEEVRVVKNKGSILPLHRCLKFINERVNAHQREPTWKEM